MKKTTGAILPILFALLTFGTAHAGLVVTELMYNPDVGPDSSYEYFVLQNQSGMSLNLSGFEVGDADDSSRFTLPNVTLLSNQYAILSELTSSIFKDDYGVTIPSNAQFLEVNRTDYFNNGGDAISITRLSDSLRVFFAEYTASAPADGDDQALQFNSSGGVVGGVSPLGSISAVPEPTSLLLFGMACLPVLRRRRIALI